MKARTSTLIAAVLAAVAAATGILAAEPAAKESDMLAHYTFSEGQGQVLKDRSGNGNDGTIRGAQWVKDKAQSALRFGPGDYVDLGVKPCFTLAGDRTVAVWVKMEAPSWPIEGTNWVVLDCGETWPRVGAILRVEGSSGRVLYRHCTDGRDTNGCTRATLRNNTVHHLVATQKNGRGAIYIDGVLEIEFALADPTPSDRPATISQAGQSFNGLMYDLAIYSRTLSTAEVMQLYREGAARHGKDTSWIGRITLTPYCHYDDGSVAVEAGFIGMLPLGEGQQAHLELGEPGKPPARLEKITAMPATGRVEHAFSLKGLPAGNYEVSACVKDAAGAILVRSTAPIAVAPVPVKPPAPNEKTVSPLPAPLRPMPFAFEPAEGGGFRLRIAGEVYPVESAFSWPKGDFNTLSAVYPVQGRCEREWTVRTRKTEDGTYRVSASGAFYAVERILRVFPDHVNVQDTITNTSPEAIGIILKHTVVTKDKGVTGAFVAGREAFGPRKDVALKTNPTLFVQKPGLGIGLAALDDVFVVQSKGDFDFDRSTLGSTQFALDKGASYTLEWSLYVSGSGDYYDFINAVRRDENRNGRADGGMALHYDRALRGRAIPTKEYVSLRKIKYLLRGDMNQIPDDPQISLESVEFLRYPKALNRMAEEMVATHTLHPELKLMFHVAHSLYCTNKPEETFPDSRVIGPDGKQPVYNGEAYYAKNPYISPERVRQGWRWWTVYPTLDNSYGRELLRSVDVMLGEMNCHGVFMDGFMVGYGGEYTYDRWDGHTAEIDPVTKTLARKVGSVLLLSQDALVAFSRKMRDKGGQVVANNSVITRTIGRETYIIFDQELEAGPWNHLAPTVVTLSDAYSFSNEKEFYYDALHKLKWANLVFYYGDYPNDGKDFLTRPPIVSQMFPMTFEEIRSGCVKGRERIVTLTPGVYGWRGDADLHFAHRYDGQGWEIPSGYLTSVDADGVRTEVTLAEKEAAVVKKVPVRVQSAAPVNVVFRQYDAKGLAVGLHGGAEATLIVSDGEFAVRPRAAYVVTTDKEERVTADAEGRLILRCPAGPCEVRVTPSAP